MLTRMLAYADMYADAYAVIFLAELSFNLLAMGPTRLFMDGKRCYWNYFEFVVVALGACATLLPTLLALLAQNCILTWSSLR